VHARTEGSRQPNAQLELLLFAARREIAGELPLAKAPHEVTRGASDISGLLGHAAREVHMPVRGVDGELLNPHALTGGPARNRFGAVRDEELLAILPHVRVFQREALEQDVEWRLEREVFRLLFFLRELGKAYVDAIHLHVEHVDTLREQLAQRGVE